MSVPAGAGEGGATRSGRQISVGKAAVGSAPRAPVAELVVQPPLIDAGVFDDPLRLEGPTVRASGTKVFEELPVRDSAI